MLYKYNTIYYEIYMKISNIQPHTSTKMNHANIILSKRSQTSNNTSCLIPFIQITKAGKTNVTLETNILAKLEEEVGKRRAKKEEGRGILNTTLRENYSFDINT